MVTVLYGINLMLYVIGGCLIANAIIGFIEYFTLGKKSKRR